MNVFALVKKNGVTKIIKDSDVSSVISEEVRLALLSIIDQIISKKGYNYIIKVQDIEKFSGGNCFNLASMFFKKIVNYKRERSYDYDYSLASCYKKFTANELRNIVLNYPIKIDITANNFAYLLKELGEIQVDDSAQEDFFVHKCGRCEDLSPLSCEKAEYFKKPITEYDFIIDGYQTYHVENDVPCLDKFIVQRCKNFKKAPAAILYYEKPKSKR